jgi:gamma-glutamylcyclotransferase (GGCT)/AIG2-like uncharacterized protein YtfP
MPRSRVSLMRYSKNRGMNGITMPDHLFVYGTLRAESGHPMARRLRVGAKLLGRGTAPGSLYDFGEYPGAIFAPDAKYRVIGDVFKLGSNPRLLADLDKYEGIAGDDEKNEGHEAKGLFERIEVAVKLDSGEMVEAWTYALKDAPRARLIGAGDFLADRRLRAPQAGRR